jgi:transcriptional regulator of acetoin/glycerol metabolism
VIADEGDSLCSTASAAVDAIPPQFAGMPLSGSEDQEVAEQIVAALRRAGGNKAKAARLLGVDRSTLYRKIRELHIQVDI